MEATKSKREINTELKLKDLIIKQTEDLKSYKRSQDALIKKVGLILERFETLLKLIKTTNEDVNESLGLAMLAIRQNEYLHTYYPAQHGYKEMKRAGKHPAKHLTKVQLHGQ